jgi:phospholipid/cholesterol/gamma-HCH transport system substrate-binding protein
LRSGQFVRASGVEIGKVSNLELVDNGKRVRVKFEVDRSIPLYQSTTAQIRYLDLIGNRYLELKRGEGDGADKIMSAGGFIPLSRTSPALDLDALIGGFKPVFRALNPDKVNTIASSLITVFQGQGGTINDILEQTAQLTNQLGERDQAIGEVVKNLNKVLDTTVRHRKDFDQTVNNLEVLITGLKDHGDQLASGTANISNGAGTVASLLSEDRALLHSTLNHLDAVQQPLVDQRTQLNDFLAKVPTALNLIGRGIGSYGDFVNFYSCDISLRINGLQAGGPVRTVRLFHQPTGRCSPQ